MQNTLPEQRRTESTINLSKTYLAPKSAATITMYFLDQHRVAVFRLLSSSTKQQQHQQFK